MSNQSSKQVFFILSAGFCSPKYCYKGQIKESEPDYIYYDNDPLDKTSISECVIIPKEKVFFNEERNLYLVDDYWGPSPSQKNNN